MTTAIDGRELTRIGCETAMGQLMRQYWIPAVLSSELARDGAPIRLMLLGEKLIASAIRLARSRKRSAVSHAQPKRGSRNSWTDLST